MIRTIYYIYGIKDQGFTFRMMHIFFYIIPTYLVTDFEKGTLISNKHCTAVYIFILVERKYFNKVRKVSYTFLKKRLTTINGTNIVFKSNFLLIAKIILTSDKY